MTGLPEEFAGLGVAELRVLRRVIDVGVAAGERLVRNGVIGEDDCFAGLVVDADDGVCELGVALPLGPRVGDAA